LKLASSIPAGQTEVLSAPLPWRANLVGVSYAGSPRGERGVEIAVRAHTSDGWSGWETLGANDNGPTGVEAKHETARATTEPVWVGTADGVEVRVGVSRGARAIHDVRLHAFNTLGDSKPQNVAARALHALGRLLRSRPALSAQPAEAETTQPAIISRAQWGADPSHLNLPCPGIAPTLKMAFVHHTDTTNSYTSSQSAAQVRAIYLYHTDSRGYCDIAYNFLVDRYGRIFEGRNGGTTKNVIGAHTGGYNNSTVGVALLGTFSSAKPTSAMMASLEKLLAWRLDLGHVPAFGKVTMITGTNNDKHAPGTAVTFNRIAGHRDASYTDCPGSQVYTLLPTVRTKVTAIGLPKIYLPTQSTGTVRPDGNNINDVVTLAATFSQTLNWTVSIIDTVGITWRTLHGTGSSLSQHWKGDADGGALVPTGIYSWRLDATDSSGHPARPATTSPLIVVSTHPAGSVLSDSTGRYSVGDTTRQTVGSVEYTSNFGSIPAVATGPGERARYTDDGSMALRDGTLLRGPDGAHYVWSDNKLHKFSTSPTDVYTTLGYTSASAIAVTDQTYLDGLAHGPDVSSITEHPVGAIVKDPTSGAKWVIEASSRRSITALAALSWYRTSEVVNAASGDLTLATGSAFPVREGALIAPTDGGAPWIVTGGVKRRFYSSSLFSAMGFTNTMLLKGSSADLGTITTGPTYGGTITHLTQRSMIPGDWNGDHVSSPGAYIDGTWYLRNANTAGGEDTSFVYGNSSFAPLAGDWDGNGTVTAGLVRGSTVYLRNSNSGGAANLEFSYGRVGDRYITGDWDGNGTDTIGVVRGKTVYLRNSNTPGAANITFTYGRETDTFVTGDWDGNGTDTIGVVRGNSVFLRNSNTGGNANISFVFGRATDHFVVGDWDGNGTDNVGIVRGVTYYLRNSNSGPVTLTFAFTA
jgi:hypothetical protein